MILSNFRDYSVTNKDSTIREPLRTEWATVTCTTPCGFLWLRKKVEDRKVARVFMGSVWVFVDTGEICPLGQIMDLATSYKLRAQVAA